MRHTFSYGAAAIQGDWAVQEDGFYADPVAGVFILADGFGGRGYGDIAVKMVLQDARSRSWQAAAQAENTQKKFMEEWNEKLCDWNGKRGAAARGGCSLLLAQAGKNKIFTITNCGACSAAIWRAGHFHVLLAPQANPREYLGMPLFPQQALGLKKNISVESRSFTLQPGDLILMGSSGLQWDSSDFQTQFGAKVAVRFPGENLAPMVQELAEIFGGVQGQAWNRSFLVFEGA